MQQQVIWVCLRINNGGDFPHQKQERTLFMFPVYYFEKMPEQLPKDDVCYIISKYIYLKKRTGLIDSLVRVDSINMGEELIEYARMKLPKIKAKTFGGVLGFFREVFNRYASESGVILNLITHPEKENLKKINYTVPHQKVSGGRCKYEIVIDPSYINCGTIHSHADFGAFHSPIDVNDEKYFDGFHITVGHVASQVISISASIVVNGKRVPVNPCKYIEGITPAETSPSYNDIQHFTIDDESSIIYNPKDIARVTPMHPKDKSILSSEIPLFDNWKFLSLFGEESKDLSPCQECVFKENRVELLHDEIEMEVDNDPDNPFLKDPDDVLGASTSDSDSDGFILDDYEDGIFGKTHLQSDSSPLFQEGERDENGVERHHNRITTKDFEKYKKEHIKNSIKCVCGTTYFVAEPTKTSECPSCEREHEGQILTQESIMASHRQEHPEKTDEHF